MSDLYYFFYQFWTFQYPHCNEKEALSKFLKQHPDVTKKQYLDLRDELRKMKESEKS